MGSIESLRTGTHKPPGHRWYWNYSWQLLRICAVKIVRSSL